MSSALYESPVQATWAGVKLGLTHQRYNYQRSTYEEAEPVFEAWRWTDSTTLIADAPVDDVIFAEDKETFERLLSEKLGCPVHTTRLEEYGSDHYGSHRRRHRDNFISHELSKKLKYGDLIVRQTLTLFDFDRGDTHRDDDLPDAEALEDLAAECQEGNIIMLSPDQRSAVSSEVPFREYYQLALPYGFLLRHGAKGSGWGDPSRAFLRFDPKEAARALARPYKSSKEIVRKPKPEVLSQIVHTLQKYLDDVVLRRINADIAKRHTSRFGEASYVHFTASRTNEYARGSVTEQIPKLIELARRESGKRWDYVEYKGLHGYTYGYQILQLEPVVRLYKRSKTYGEKPFGLWLETEIANVRRWHKLRDARQARASAAYAEKDKVSLYYGGSQRNLFWNAERTEWVPPAEATRYETAAITHSENLEVPESTEREYFRFVTLNASAYRDWKPKPPEKTET